MMSTAADAHRGENAGTSAPRLATSTVATAAIANVSTIHRRNPARNPTKGPNATSMYAYGPPVIDTRLPASARHKTMSPMEMAQSTWATGAVAPSVAAMSAGRRKMPPPIVTLTMLAARARGPMERRRDDSDDAALGGKVRYARLLYSEKASSSLHNPSV